METNQYTQVNLQQRKQWTLLSKSLLVAGIGFLIIFGFGWGLYAILISSYHNSKLTSETLNTLMVTSMILLFVVIFMSMWCWARITRVHTSTILAMISFYAIAEGLCLGVFLFSLQLSAEESLGNYHLSDIFWIFGLTGGMFMLCGLIGQMLSVRFTMTLGKFLMVASFAFLFFLLITMFIGLFGGSSFMSEKWSIGINAFFGLLMILYIMFDFSVIKKSEVFMSAMDSNMQLKFTLMFGFKLLIDLMGLFWTIARFYLIARR